MNLQTASRKKAKIKMGLQGPSGSGKTMGALLTAYGICGDWTKIAVLDAENQSADLYAHLGSYNVLSLSTPFTPEKYIQAIDVCIKSEMEVIIIDSESQLWGYLLDYHSSLQGNSFTNWSKVNLRYYEYVQKMLQCPAHIISNIRTKHDYVLNEKNGKMVPEKVGLKAIQRPEMEYEYTLVFDLDMKNHYSASKDRTGLFFGKPEQKLSVETGKLIREWCNTSTTLSVDELSNRIIGCKNVEELLKLYHQHPEYKDVLKPDFEKRKRQILINQEVVTELINQKKSSNGIH